MHGVVECPCFILVILKSFPEQYFFSDNEFENLETTIRQ